MFKIFVGVHFSLVSIYIRHFCEGCMQKPSRQSKPIGIKFICPATFSEQHSLKMLPSMRLSH
jgi:hypothetical protein